ncbi:type II secretion system F family protein [Salinarimonas soli]|uniref:Type II secretion system F family protein n=1 Tax=Salinarimonas soli TaxID=1638099 RepID=A0A5B2V971_9HYPH|nr:type II secretion system F family protein [Salinarimonas soli]KAA2235000.1 type II secretion system F family protein [Salinarimonas soli]
MLSLILSKVTDPQFVAMILVAIAAAATVYTIAMPFLEGDDLSKRMKAVALERDRIRARERDRLVNAQGRTSLRQEPKAYMKRVVDRFKLGDWLGTETAKKQLLMAGYRGPQAEVAFLFFRLVVPIGLMILAVFYLFVLNALNQPLLIRLGLVISATYLGIKLPEVFLKNTITKRQDSIRRAWPDSLDLLLICVEAGMSIEQAFRRVSTEVGSQSVPLAEEFTLTTAELSYLQERRLAYENLATRTGLETVKAITTALIQAERYGTPLGTALRVLAQESRDMRMNEAEKKAAALPPKLTVPMILFFLPVLFVVIMTPALTQVFGWR